MWCHAKYHLLGYRLILLWGVWCYGNIASYHKPLSLQSMTCHVTILSWKVWCYHSSYSHYEQSNKVHQEFNFNHAFSSSPTQLIGSSLFGISTHESHVLPLPYSTSWPWCPRQHMPFSVWSQFKSRHGCLIFTSPVAAPCSVRPAHQTAVARLSAPHRRSCRRLIPSLRSSRLSKWLTVHHWASLSLD
jgi:hypothetical protein